MSRLATTQCDGPACLEILDAEDDEECIEQGWFVVEFDYDGDRRFSHLCSLTCIVAWASEDLV